MLKEYAYLSVGHPGLNKNIQVDIEVEVEPNASLSCYNPAVFDSVIVPIINDFLSCGISAEHDSVYLHEIPRQSEYVGTSEDVIHKIVNEA